MKQTTLDIIKRIAAINPGVDKINLISYAPQKDLFLTHKDKWTEEDDKAYMGALLLREEMKMPFWYSLMVSIINQSKKIPLNCLYGALSHNEIKSIQWISPAEIDNLDMDLYEGGRIALNSKVIMANGEYRYIPMIDFHLSISQRNEQLVREVCKILGESGYLLNSGKSYHFIGKTLMTYEKNLSFLGKALLSAPIVDEIWIAHQLQDGSCSLRLGYKYGQQPFLVVEI